MKIGKKKNSGKIKEFYMTQYNKTRLKKTVLKCTWVQKIN